MILVPGIRFRTFYIAQTFRFTAEESRCDEDTYFEYYSFHEEQDGENVLYRKDERCNQTNYSAVDTVV